MLSNQIELIAFIKANLIGETNLSIRGLATLCGVQDTSIIRGAAFNSKKLAEKLEPYGFEPTALVENGFDAKASWLVIEYFAYDSKAKADQAKQIARTFGAIGIMTTFEKLSRPKTALELAREQVKLLERMELLEAEKALLEADNKELATAVDELFEYSSIIRVAKFNRICEKNFKWQTLKAASVKLGLEVKRVPCPRFEYKLLYSHQAWRLAYPNARLPETTTLVINHNY